MIHQKQEMAQATMSYSLGCGGLLLGWICDAAEFWQALALFIGVIVIGIRAAHDALRFYRAIKNGGQK